MRSLAGLVTAVLAFWLAYPVSAGILVRGVQDIVGDCRPTGHDDHVVCDSESSQKLLAIRTQADLDKFKQVSSDISAKSTSDLRVIQFMDVCSQIDCRGIDGDGAKALVGSELNTRSESEKTFFTKISTTTGTASLLLSFVSLGISVATFQRGRVKKEPAGVLVG